jgi:hypothetical protein
VVPIAARDLESKYSPKSEEQKQDADMEFAANLLSPGIQYCYSQKRTRCCLLLISSPGSCVQVLVFGEVEGHPRYFWMHICLLALVQRVVHIVLLMRRRNQVGSCCTLFTTVTMHHIEVCVVPRVQFFLFADLVMIHYVYA